MTKQREIMNEHLKERKIKEFERDIERLEGEIELKRKILEGLKKSK